MWSKVTIVPVVVAALASTTLAFASAVGAARTCSDAVTEPRRLHVRIVAASRMDDGVITYAQREVETIWRAYHVEVVWTSEAETSAAPPELTVEFVPNLPTHSAAAIAWVLFNEGRPLPLARVSIPAAMRLLARARSWFDGRPMERAAAVMRDEALGRIVGRSLAHEIGHFLLASSGHTRNGLMRGMIDADQFVRPGLDLFLLEDREARALRATRIADCEWARVVAATAP